MHTFKENRRLHGGDTFFLIQIAVVNALAQTSHLVEEHDVDDEGGGPNRENSVDSQLPRVGSSVARRVIATACAGATWFRARCHVTRVAFKITAQMASINYLLLLIIQIIELTS